MQLKIPEPVDIRQDETGIITSGIRGFREPGKRLPAICAKLMPIKVVLGNFIHGQGVPRQGMFSAPTHIRVLRVVRAGEGM